MILVDLYDNQIGCCTKAETHEKELLHRAFSLFIYNRIEKNFCYKNELLINIILEDYGQTHVVHIRDMEKNCEKQ